MSILDRHLATLAFCWRLQRRDGVCIGFTTHDREIVVGNLGYRAAPGMLPSAISVSDGFEADTLDVSGALTSEAITAQDLDQGRWDGADVTIFMVDWEQPEAEQVQLASGTLGDVSTHGGGFIAELRGRTATLDRPVVEQTSPECRAELGDKRCRVDMAARVLVTRVVSAPSEGSVEVAAISLEPNAYSYGRLRWLSGGNSGIESELVSSQGAVLRLREPPPLAPAAGDLVEISEGCDKRFDTCRIRFGNSANFRGEPYLPGMDLLTRYPGA